MGRAQTVPRLCLHSRSPLAVSCSRVERRNPQLCSALVLPKAVSEAYVVLLSCLTLCTDIVHRLGTCSEANRTSQFHDFGFARRLCKIRSHLSTCLSASLAGFGSFKAAVGSTGVWLMEGTCNISRMPKMRTGISPCCSGSILKIF